MRCEIKGQITVFLSLILLLLLSLVFTCLESARSEGLKLRAALAADAALQSVFAQYDRPLWDSYGLLFFAGRSTGEVKTIAEEYAKANCGGGNLLTGDWLTMETEDLRVNAAAVATEQEGAVFRRAVCDYMEACGILENARQLYSRLSADDTEEISISGMLDQADALEDSLDSSEELLPEGETPERDKEAEGQFKGLLKCLRKWKQKGFLEVVAENADQVSSKNYDTEGFPSKMAASAKSAKSCTLPAESAADKLLYYEYLIRHLDDYITSGGESCQLEYVITGKASDRSCLSSVVKRILGIRYAADLAWLSANGEKRGEAEALALAVTGWTANPVIVEACRAVILMVWALGEAISEVKSLMEGKRIPLVKKSCTVKLSDVAGGAGQTKDSGSGLSYEDYLRILLLSAGKKTTAYRAMDMIQLTVQKTEPDFRFQCGIYGARITVDYTAGALFPLLPEKGGHAFSESAEYAYGSVQRFQ